ncbi:OmpA family protein [Dechloromonas sp. ZY10]|uniref:OmpA family protein n=1 Tax=Dechloromonas aquae TaxID=2664436 RepID=UPI0035299F16
MNKQHHRPWLLLALALLAGCSAGPRERIVLLPDRSGQVGAIIVEHGGRSVEVAEAYAGTRLESGKLNSEKIGETAVRQRYQAAIEGLPASPQRYLLNFEFGNDKLTAASRAMLPTILADLRNFPAPEVLVIGHTDAVGTTPINDRLSLERANRVRELLVGAGIPRDAIQVAGRGSREPLVAHRPGTQEPRNRRVEIKLR